MSKRDMSAEVMTSITGEFVDENGPQMSILKSNPYLEGARLAIIDTHNRLVSVSQQTGSNEKQAQELTAEMTRLDARHDQLARGIDRVLEGGAILAIDDEAGERTFSHLRQLLFPRGLSITQRSYRDQAGMAKRVLSQLDDDDRARLDEIKVGKRSFLALVEDWLATAKRIARLEAKRARLQKRDSDDAVSAGEVRDARIAWIQAINSLITMLDFADIDEDDRHTLLANLEDASRKAAESRRRAEARAAEKENEELEEPEQPEQPQEPAVDGDADSDVTEPV